MSDDTPSSSALRVADLSPRPYPFDLKPDQPVLAAMAQDLSLDGLRKMRFSGQIAPLGKADWQLTGTLGATIEQTCSVSLAPVRTRIDVPVTRRFLSSVDQPEEPETEMPDDETIEPLGPVIDPFQVMVEALSLEIPAYPRAAGVDFASAQFTAPGEAPMTDQDARPFAGLADLRAQLEKKQE